MNLSRICQVQVPTVVVSIVMSSTHLNPLFIFLYSSYSFASLSLHDIIHLHDIHTFGINLDHGIPLSMVLKHTYGTNHLTTFSPAAGL